MPGEYELVFLDPEPLALLSIMPDEPLRRLVRGISPVHRMMHCPLCKPTSERIYRTSQFCRTDWVPGSHTGTVLRDLLRDPVDLRLVDALVAGPCRKLRLEEPTFPSEDRMYAQDLEQLWDSEVLAMELDRMRPGRRSRQEGGRR